MLYAGVPPETNKSRKISLAWGINEVVAKCGLGSSGIRNEVYLSLLAVILFGVFIVGMVQSDDDDSESVRRE